MVPLNPKEIRSLTAYKALFEGPHMIQKVAKVTEGGFGIMRFAKVARFITNQNELCMR